MSRRNAPAQERAKLEALQSHMRAEQAAQQSEAAREAELEAEMQAEQCELDQRKFRLLLAHAEALRSVLPHSKEVGETKHTQLLERELEDNDAARAELRARWGWDAVGSGWG